MTLGCHPKALTNLSRIRGPISQIIFRKVMQLSVEYVKFIYIYIYVIITYIYIYVLYIYILLYIIIYYYYYHYYCYHYYTIYTHINSDCVCFVLMDPDVRNPLF